MAGIYDERILGAKQQAETARKLREGITAPQGQMVSGWYVQPSMTQYLANALKTYGSAKQEREAQSEYENLRKQKEQETERLMRQLEPQAQVQVSPEFANAAYGQGDIGQVMAQGPQTQTTYAQPDERTRMAALLRGASVNPEAFQPQLQMAQWEMSQAEKEAARKQAEGLRREQMQMQREMQQERLQAQREMSAQSAADRRALALGLAGMKQQEGMTTTATGQRVPQKVADAQDALMLLQTAAPIVRQSTGSGVGAGVDWLAGQAGMTTEGAANAARLKAIGGQLIAKMPKMSGPQSDKDVQLYREMAGQIGDPTVPSGVKEAAMQTIAELQAKYAGVQTPQLQFGGNATQSGSAQFLGFE